MFNAYAVENEVFNKKLEKTGKRKNNVNLSRQII